MDNLLTNKKNKNRGRAFLIYFWGFPLIQFLILLAPSISTLIVFALLALSCCVWLYDNFETNLNRFTLQTLAIVAVLIYFIFNILLRRNDYSLDYLVHFIMYGVLSIIFVTSIDDFDLFMVNNVKCAIFVLLAYAAVPIIGFDKLGMDYMDFGFGVTLPIYMSLYIARHAFGQRKMLFFEVLCFIELVLFANRSCFLSVLFVWMMRFILFKKKKPIHYILISLALIVVLVLLANLKPIVLWINQEIFVKYDIDFRFWQKIRAFVVSGDWNKLFSGRLDIWNNAIELIKQRPFIGWGLGYFESVYGEGCYTHNIILEVAVEIGIIGTALAGLFLIFNSVKAFRCAERNTKYVLLLFLCLAIPKLLLSTIHYKDIALWAFIALILRYLPNKGAKNESTNGM